MKWFKFAQDQAAPAEGPGGASIPEPPPPVPEKDQISPIDRGQQKLELQRMFREIGWKDPEIMHLLQKDPPKFWRLMQSIDNTADEKPATMDKAKAYFKKKELQFEPPPGDPYRKSPGAAPQKPV